jgi:hypothetical protein
MANRRMFSKVVTNSDSFLDMPGSSQALYFHLGMNADDDGFVQARTIVRQVGANPDDLKLLLAKGFLISFEDGVIVVKDWKVNNEIRVDRYKETFYVQHKSLLRENEQKQYEIASSVGSTKKIPVVIPTVLPSGDNLDTQVRLGKVRLGDTAPTQNYRRIDDIGAETLKEIAEMYEIEVKTAQMVWENCKGWYIEKGKKAANYKQALQNWVRKDLTEGKIAKKRTAKEFVPPVFEAVSDESQQRHAASIKSMLSEKLSL